MTATSWAGARLGAIVDILDARRIPVSASERAKRSGDVPYYGAAGQVGLIDEPLFNEPLVLLGEDGVQFFDPFKSKAYLIQGPAWVNNHAHVLRARSTVDRRFLGHYLNQFDYRGYANGTTRLKLTQAAMRRIPVPLPAMTEQRRIVDILEDHLSRLDAAVHEISVSRQRLEGLRDQLVMAALTGRAVTAARHTSVPQGVGANDGVLPELPLGWTWSRLEDVADVVGGVTKDAKKQSDPGYVEVPYLRVANVQRGRLILDSVTKIRVAPAKAAALRLRPGDVLLNEGGDRDKLARGWVWEDQIELCIHQNHVFRARVRYEIVDPYFLSWTANTIGSKWAERNGKQSVNLASISLSMIRKMPVIIPPLRTSSQIVDRLHASLSSLNRLDAALDSAAQRSRSLRQALLAAAFSGRLTGWTSDLDLAEETATEAFQSDSAAILG